MSFCEWQEHEGKRYLRLVYGADPATAPAVTERAFALVSAEPDGTVIRCLVDLREASMTGWQRDGLSDGRRAISDLARRHTFRTAVLGVRGPLVALMRGMSMVTSGYKAIPCPTEEAALDYLIRQ